VLNDPVVIEGNYGKGKVVLSLVHFDTPDDANGRRVLKNLWRSLSPERRMQGADSGPLNAPMKPFGSSPYGPLFEKCESTVADLIDFGIRNFLWFWRNPMLLQWRRGVRGLEYCTLYIMIQEIGERLRRRPAGHDRKIEEHLKDISQSLPHFTEKAKKLLIRERLAMQHGHITYERCDDPEIQKIREELFSSSKSYGGLFKSLVGKIDTLLYLLLEHDEMKRDEGRRQR
jgi:hypothetical protein